MPRAPQSTRTLVLLDTHAILHRAYHALPEFTAPDGAPTGALYGVVNMLLKIDEELTPDFIVACYDLPESTYRHLAYDGYKAGRAKTDDELAVQIDRSRELLRAFGIPIYEAAGFEADDILGTIARVTADDPSLAVIIASGDMDTLQLVEGTRVRVYTLKKGIRDTIVYDEQAVCDRFGFSPDLIPDYKGLRGDPSDNIPGIPGVGEQTASALVQQFGSIDQIYKSLAQGEDVLTAKGVKPRVVSLLRAHEEEARFSKMLATIRTDAPIDFACPDTPWPKGASPEVLQQLFHALGFRAQLPRVDALLRQGESPTPAAPSRQEDDAPDADTLARAGVKLWLLASEYTNPTRETIIEYGRQHYQLERFAEIDAALTRTLQEIPDLWAVYTEIEQPLMRVIAYLNEVGIPLDTDYLHTLSQSLHRELSEIEARIHAHAGMTFNINSPKQLAEVLFDKLELHATRHRRTATGQRTTKESELKKLEGKHPIIDEILRYRELAKLLSTYIDSFPKLVAADGRLRTTFLQTGTTTGRLASRDPNLQNIPIRSEDGRALRRGFVAAPGYRLVSIDYSQIDLRAAAILSGDSHLIEIFQRNEDVHTGVAARVFAVDASEVTKEMRRKAKVINFGILYGMGVNALRANLGAEATREEAQEFLNTYFARFTELTEYLEAVKAHARTHGYTTTLFGRRRWFPNIQSNRPQLRAASERMAMNAPIQGTAADVMRIAMNRVYDYQVTHDLFTRVRMMLQVHDEILFEIHADDLATHIPELVTRMETVLEGKETHGVPLQVDVAVGDNWRDLTAWKAPRA